MLGKRKGGKEVSMEGGKGWREGEKEGGRKNFHSF